jgi:hypothetical protein
MLALEDDRGVSRINLERLGIRAGDKQDSGDARNRKQMAKLHGGSPLDCGSKAVAGE